MESGSVVWNVHQFYTEITDILYLKAWCDFLDGVLPLQLLRMGGKVPIVCPSMLIYQLAHCTLLLSGWGLTWNSVSFGARLALCEMWHLMLASSSLVFFLSHYNIPLSSSFTSVWVWTYELCKVGKKSSSSAGRNFYPPCAFLFES